MSRGPAWTELEHLQLIHKRKVLNLPWSQISLPGRSSKACENEFYAQRLAYRDQPELVGVKRRGRPIKPLPPKVIAVLEPAPVARDVLRRQRDLTALRERAELHARIARQGVTGAVLGDPPPGCSALDKRMAGADEPRGPSLPQRGFNAWC